jgi:hypothetical protein
LANDYQPQKYGGNGTVSKTFTAISAVTDLRAQSGYPTHAPGRVTASNPETAASDIVYTDLRGNSNTFAVPAASSHVIDEPVATLEALTGDTIDVTATWWVDSATRFNP